MMLTPAKTETALKTVAVEPVSPQASPALQSEVGLTSILSAYLRETLPLDLSELAQDVVAQMLTEGRLDGVDIHYHLPEERVSVELPRLQFAEILEQMVTAAAGAMKALTNRTHVLRVIVEDADPFGDFGPRLRVQDTGASVIVEDALQEAIERAETLGAKLTVKNRPMGGNIFTVELPAEQIRSW
ncbi:HAMP domain-containing histidine kinase [Hyalangium minutum]|uniref:Adenylate cyclase n=1 Tax=Hyalangium minutum TaxID=394096 RepID=A0A085W759_9BACT|nr:HAMP domain-containing histidine kinase [Hyalangium minutum]KFE63522.1 Adenylate cyclase [Hyalangium minutum]